MLMCCKINTSYDNVGDRRNKMLNGMYVVVEQQYVDRISV